MTSKIAQYYSSILLLILGFAFFSRVFALHQPEGYMFDEVYHAVTAKLIANNDPRAYEWWNPAPEPETAVDWLHPPVAKYTQAFFIYFLGENSFAWRFSSAVFGVGVIWLTALLSKELFNSKSLSLLAAFLASLDGLLLVQSRIAMNDIHVTFFILLTLLMYAKHLKSNLKIKTYSNSKYLLAAGVSAGLAMATKWSGVFALAIVGLIEGVILLNYAWMRRNNFKKELHSIISAILKIIFCLIIIPVIVYFFSYLQMFLQGKDLHHFYELHQQIWHYQTTLEATHPAQSRPWQWFLNLKPAWFAVDYASDTHIGNIYAFGNPIIFILGILGVFWTAVFLILNKSKLSKFPLLILLLASYLAVWLPWQLSPRIMFFYHYTPAVPLMVILICYWLRYFWNKYSNSKTHNLIVFAVAAALCAFIIWYPHWTNMPVSIEFADKVYFFVDSWRQ